MHVELKKTARRIHKSQVKGAKSVSAAESSSENTATDTVSLGNKHVKLQILHTTDMHGSALPVQRKVKSGEETVRVDRGGLDRVAQLAAELRKDYPMTLFVDSGDTVSGQVTTDVDGGRSMVDIMNHMDYDAVTIGNHEFDFGPETMKERIATSAFPTLIANVHHTDGSPIPNTESSKVVDFGEAKVGIVGLLTDSMPALARSENIKGFTFEDPIKALKRELPKLREQDVDAVVVLTHQSDIDDRKLAQAFPDEGLIIPGGHTHTEFSEVENIDGNFLFKSGTQGAAMGRLVATINTETNRPEGLQFEMLAVDTQSLDADSEITELVTGYKAKADETMAVEVGHVAEDLELDAQQDSNLGNLVTDAMRDYHKTDVALVNTDGLRTSVAAGTITEGDIHAVFPFQGDEALKSEITGAQLEAVLNTSIKRADTDGKSPFLQVSGVTFGYDENGVHDLKVGGADIEPDKTYSLASSTYLSGGTLGYKELGELEWANGGIPMTTMFKEYLGKVDWAKLDQTGTRITDNRAN